MFFITWYIYLKSASWDLSLFNLNIFIAEDLTLKLKSTQWKEALLKFNAFYRLVTGVLEKIKTNQELMEAIGTLGWNTGGDEDE